MKTAVVQEPPVYLNLDASMARAIEIVERAARDGAKLIVFPEAWFPGYPTFVWRLSPGADMGKTDELFAKLQENCIDLSRNQLAPLQEAAREGGCWVIGCATAIEASDVLKDTLHLDTLFPNKDEWLNFGDAVVYEPFGGIAAGPMHRERAY